MRNWLSTKAEEERRKAEEEKTRQESLRLEQRRVEQAMLRESMQGGVPPHMIPMIFAGMGGANLANVSLDWLQQYAAQLQASQQQVQDAVPELRRETRMINPQASYPPPPAAPQQVIQSVPVAPAPPPPQPLAQHQTTFSAYPPAPPSPSHRARNMPVPPTSAPRTTAQASLPRLTTNEMIQHPPPTAPSSAHPLHQTQTVQQEQAASPSILFHYWVPPSQDSKPNPPTPSGRNEPQSHHADAEYTNSPRKRKAQGPHQPAPPPSHHTSPTFSTTSNSRKHVHSRSRSNASTKEEYYRHTPGRRDSAAARGSQADSTHSGRSRDSSQRLGQPSGPAPPSPIREAR